ncbi:MAG TPA: DJ-1/PfpI family protein, partial [Acidimicrobiia bacterium]|nr:DJ-1/PfpI family protein [Acidimicrobiia bacterium]
MTTTIDIVLFDGVDELDAVGPLEVLRGAAAHGADLAVRLVTRTEPLAVTGNHGLGLRADGVYAPGADILLVPGGGWIARAETGAWAEAERGDWLPLIKAAADAGVLLAGVCTGVMLLARAGVIGARPATTHHAAKAELEAAGVKVVDQRVVDAGGLVTAGGVTSGLDLGLRLVERLAGPEAAVAEATRLEYPWTPTAEAAAPGTAPAGHPAPAGHTITTEPVEG